MLTNRNARIDFLRGISIFLVLMLHFILTYPLGNIFHLLFRNGNYGVTIFFVISGFLITSNALTRHGELYKISVVHFYTLRFARIFPCLLLALASIIGLSFMGLPSFTNTPYIPVTPPISIWESAFSVISFWHNVMMEKYGYFNYAMNIYWSLSVEEVFYLLFPIICLIAKNKNLLLLFLFSCMIISPLYRSLHADNDIIYMYSYLACFDAIAFGCFTALIKDYSFMKALKKNYIQLGAIIVLVFTYLAGIKNHEIFGFSLIAGATAILLLGAKNTQSVEGNNNRRARRHKILHTINLFFQFLGKLSYELYLFHIIILGLIRDIIGTSGFGALQTTLLLMLYLTASIFFSHLIARFYSEPLNQKIRRLQSSPRTHTLCQ